MRRKLNQLFLLVILLVIFYAGNAQSVESPLCKQLRSLNGCINVTSLKHKTPFTEKYLVNFKQYINPSDTTVGWFKQRVFVSHYSYDAPTVMVTEGYGADYAANENYIDELARIFKTNEIFVEHRYFGQSKPENSSWQYLTTTNAAADHHNVRQTFGEIYKNKWIATGISKGGETALIYRTLYPNDVDITVCYVAPLTFAVEDGRHEPFIANVPGTKADRDKVKAFQIEVLKKKKKIMPLFKAWCDEKQYTFNLPIEEIYDYCVLEFSFSFWQWGWKPSSIPSKNSSIDHLLKFLVRVASPDYFANEGIEPTRAFYVQAARELGYYGYDTKPFQKYLTIKTAQDYLNNIFMPKDYRVNFDSTISKKCADYIRQNDPEMIFIYGEYDPWTAAAVNFTDKKNMLKVIGTAGSHACRISNLPTDLKNEVIERINKWLEK